MTYRAHFAEFFDVDTRKALFVRPEHVAAVETRAMGGVRLTLVGGRTLAVCGTAPVIAKELEIASLKAIIPDTEPA